MRLSAITFNRYGPGQTDFGNLLRSFPQAGVNELENVLKTIARQITSPVPNTRVSLIIVGHSDRQDRNDFTCDQKRASEIDAARDRAISAWEWIKMEVNSLVVNAGGEAGEWWETSPHVTWGLVFAAAGMLEHAVPTDDQRELNRRVVVLASVFRPE